VQVSIFNFSDYKEFVREWIRARPLQGRGQYKAMAKRLRVHTSLLSHIFRGAKNLGPEQACHLAAFLGLNELETDYLLALVDRARAGTTVLQEAIQRRIEELRERHQRIESRVPGARRLTLHEQGTFYSQWYYSAVRLTASLQDISDAKSIADRLRLPVPVVERCLSFLVAARLLIAKNGRYELGTKRTHLGADSPLAAAHHRNWRVRAMAMYEQMSPSDFAFSAPMALSRRDFLRIRELLVECIAEVTAIVDPSDCETAAVLNIDLLQF
jgi:uncharacterized protein (TIGR02147 family)